MSRLISFTRRAIAATALSATVLVTVPRASAQEGPYEPWIGEKAITETVEQIMARDALTRPWSPEDGLRMVEEQHVDRSNLAQNPDAPAVSRWPINPNDRDLGFGEGGRPRPGMFNPQTVSTSFIGPRLSESGFIPPDTTGAVGPTQILIAANGRIKVYSKTGVVGGLNVTVDSFFNSVRNGIQVSDPQVKYDVLTGRWMVAAINVASTNNRVVIAVSSGPTITNTASFTFYFFQQNLVAPAGNTNQFADHPKVGVDANAMYIGCNMFGGGFVGTTGWVVRKSSILSGGPIAVTAFRGIGGTTGTGVYTPMGVDNDDPAATEGYFIGTDISTFSKLVMRRVSNPGGAPSISGNLIITTPTTVNPQSQPALGSTSNLDAIDDRLSYCSIRLNRASGARTLWTAHQIEVNSAGVASTTGNRNGSRWYEVQNLTTTPVLRQSGTVFDPAAATPKGYWFPACIMSGQGHMAIGTSFAGAADRAQMAVAGRLRTDALGTTQAVTVAQTSTTAYNVQAGTQRWGDYAQAWVDPTDDQTIWMFAEYCDATNSWAERCVKLLAPPPVTPSLCSPANVAQGASNVDVVVSGSSINGSEFYDTEPGINRLIAQVSGAGVTVNSVTFSHATPTQFTMNISVSGGAATGARNVTVTNPDGQQATGNGILTIDGGGTCPSFDQHPAAQTVCSGGSASFTVAASGSPAPSYQWRKNGGNLSDGGNISGANTPNLVINPVGTGDAGSYDCVASNGCANGPTTSNSATLTVDTAASIDVHPSNQQGKVGGSRSFTVTTSGTGPTTYQWRKDGGNLSNGGSISGADTATLTIDPLALGDAGSYDVIVTNPCGNLPSNAATLEVFCRADYNMDGFVDGIDYDQFNNDFEAGSLAADYNGDGFVDGIDYDEFNNDFETDGGCV